MGRISRWIGVLGLGVSQLNHERMQTVFAILGVAIAVLSATLLVGVGYGVVATGEEKFDASGRDIWVAGGPVQIQPGTVGGMQGSLYDSHTVARDIQNIDGVRTAVPLLFQTVYAGSNPDDVETTLAVGVPGVGGSSVNLESGSGFSQSGRVHYADGAYDGPRVQEVVLDPRLSERYGTGINDSLHVGGTVVDARSSTYRVVGTSRTFSTFLGTPVVTLPLSELQTMTGAARSDSATLITVNVETDADINRVESEIQAAYPQYDVRTNEEQFQAVLAKQALVIASGLVLVVLGIVSGLALTVNVLTLLVYQQEQELAALRAIGISQSSLAQVVGVQGVVISFFGGALGLALTPPLSRILSLIAYNLVGFEGLVRTPEFVYGVGIVVAVVIGVIATLIAGWRVANVELMTALRG